MRLNRCLRPAIIVLSLFVVTFSTSIAQPAPRAVEGYAEVNGTKLYYEEAGSGRAVVLVPGGLVDSRLWDDQLNEFARRYRVIRYDLRGFGKSASPAGPFSPIDDLHALLKFLKIERARVIGLSLGGMIATDFTLEHPQMVEKLVLVGSSLRGYNQPPSKELMAVWENASTIGAEKFAERWMATALFSAVRDDPRLRARMQEMMIDNYKALALLGPGAMRYPQTLTIQRLGQITAPTLVVVGSRDDAVLLGIADTLQSKIAGAQKRMIPGASHHPNIERPKEFNRIVLDFLKSR